MDSAQTPNLHEMTIDQFIKTYQPCAEAQAWLATQSTLADAWDNCERSDWLMWASWKIGIEKSVRVNLACDFAERVLPIFEKRYPNDKRPSTAIEKARAWVKLQTEEARIEAKAAASASASASASADAASASASADAAYAAADAASASAYAYYAAAAAAAAYAYAYYAAAAAAAAYAGARANECKWQCNHIREIISNPFRQPVTA